MSVDVAPRAAERRRASAEQKGPSQLPWHRREGGETRWERRVGERGCSESSHGGLTCSVKRRSGPLVRGAEQGRWEGLKVSQPVSRMGGELTRPWRGVPWEHRTIIPHSEGGGKI